MLHLVIYFRLGCRPAAVSSDSNADETLYHAAAAGSLSMLERLPVHTFQLCSAAIQFVSLSRGERESRLDARDVSQASPTLCACVQLHASINAPFEGRVGSGRAAALVWLRGFASLRLRSADVPRPNVGQNGIPINGSDISFRRFVCRARERFAFVHLQNSPR